ncbi:MAG: hypothetical protein SVM80_06190 [Halobacteriota archaeon]|nr:hypothetical protein [Halobacteriota archaeon]
MSSSGAIFGFILLGTIWTLILYLIFSRRFSYRSRVIPVTMVLAVVVCAVGYFGIGFLHGMETSESCGNCHVMAPWYYGNAEMGIVDYRNPGDNMMMAAHSLHEPHHISCSNCHAGPGVMGLLGGVLGGIIENIQTMLDAYEEPIHAHYPDEKCTKCHYQRFDSYHLSSVLIKEEGIECKECHRPHDLDSSGLEGCDVCHEDIPATVHHSGDMECVVCHKEHGGGSDCGKCHTEDMVRETCEKCHDEPASKLSSQGHSMLDCSSCHDTVGPAGQHGTVVKDCVDCHGVVHNPSVGCTMCHREPHTPRN